jgi:hypothetical protein
VLRAYRFCNVYREQDTVTVWVDDHIRRPYAEHPNLWFMLCIARQINLPETLTALQARAPYCWPVDSSSWSPAKTRTAMLERAGTGGKLYTSAYMLTCPWPAHYKGPRDKPMFTCHRVLAPLWEDRVSLRTFFENTLRIEQVVRRLSQYEGWGEFLAYEVACDLRYTRYLDRASDRFTWANPGPGATRALNYLRDRPLEAKPAKSILVDEMRHLLEFVSARWDYSPPLELREIEHSLCELFKYVRGSSRQKFRPQ